MNLKSNLKKQLFVTAVAQTPPHHPSRPRWVGMLLVLKGDRECRFFFVKMTSVQKALIHAVITVTVGNSKGKKEGIMHLLMASFRALPLDLMMPVSRRRIVWIFFFSYICPLFFIFFLAPFHWLSQSERAISPALSVCIPLHMRTSRHLRGASARKSLVRLSHELIAVW